MAATPNVSTVERSSPRPWSGLLGRESGIIIGLLALCVVFSWLNPAFMRVDNLLDVALQSSITAVLAIGMTIVIITAGIDLSVGSMVALSAYLTADLMARGVSVPWPSWPGWGVACWQGRSTGS